MGFWWWWCFGLIGVGGCWWWWLCLLCLWGLVFGVFVFVLVVLFFSVFCVCCGLALFGYSYSCLFLFCSNSLI
ncbi:hypothetical protein, partial [Pseudomonas syringae group genomosp. 7]|uniref:hypothetical protein n=1 Tax=Pseudomonas syringae group genomosp. 7 TaxID=251699 RepID=UPI00376F716E